MAGNKSDPAKAMQSLSLETSSPAKPKTKPKKVVADSWEDESSDDEPPQAQPRRTTAGTSAPPPTPMSPTYHTNASPGSRPPIIPSKDGEERRPEKTDAVARRMIAAGLGLKAPKLTDEQKAYQKSVREQEKKRREQEREEKKRQEEEVAKAKAAMWDD